MPRPDPAGVNRMGPRYRQALFLLGILILAACTSDPPATPRHSSTLFNGSDLSGWEHIGKGEFIVEDNTLKTVGGMGLLWYTREKFGNATIRIVYRGETPDANAGVFIRIPEKPQDAYYPIHFGYEVQVRDQGDEFHRTGSLYSLSRADTFPPSDDGWNTMEIRLDGQTTTVSVNGQRVNTFNGLQPVPARKKWYEPQRGPRPDEGYIGLQNHDEESTIWFREVSVLPVE